MTTSRLWGSSEDERDLPRVEIADLICKTGRRLWEKDLTGANAGNISYRLDENRVLATPTMISKGFMEPDDLVVVDMNGRQIEGKRRSTSEIRLHLVAYASRADMRAVIHAHPPHAAAFAATGVEPPSCVLSEAELVFGEVAMAPYGTPGTQAFADAMKPFLAKHCALILAQHGALTMGAGLIEAFWRMETLESYCRTLIAARALGEPLRLSREQMREILETKKRLGAPDRRIEERTFE